MLERATEFRGFFFKLFFDRGAPRSEARNHFAFVCQRFCILFCMLQRDITHADKAVTVRDAPGVEPQYRYANDVAAEQCDQTVRRTHELHAFKAAIDLVGHDFGYRQIIDRVVERCL